MPGAAGVQELLGVGSEHMKAGGVDMPAKADMHDWTTPSGCPPTVLSGKAMWNALKAKGFDMRWYVVARPIPISQGAVVLNLDNRREAQAFTRG
jgi:hypothetical protein